MFTSDMREWVKENAKKWENDRDGFIAEICKRFNKTPNLVIDMLRKMRSVGQLPRNAFLIGPSKNASRATAPVKSVVSAAPTKGKQFRMSVDILEIKKEFDDEGKIEEGIAALGTHLIKDNDFRMELGVSLDRWKVVSALPKFANNKYELKGKRFKGTYWGQPSVIRDLKKKVELL